MKRVYVWCAFIIAVSLIGPSGEAFAAKATGRVGIFDMQKIIRESKAGKEAKGTLEKELAERRERLVKEEKSLRELYNELSEKEGLDYAEKKKRERELSKELKDLRRLKADLEEEIKDMDEELTVELLKDVVAIVKDIGEEKGYDIIMQKSANMVYIKDAVDLTDEIKKAYDEKTKD